MNKQEWISVKDRLPDDSQLVVAAKLYDWEDPDAAVCLFFHNCFHLSVDGLSAENYDGGAVIKMDFTPTHWMSLPEKNQ